MSLLDKVLESKDNPSADLILAPQDDRAHVLEDGAVIYDSTIAAINRILEVNPHLHKRPTGIAAEPYILYNGHTPVDLTERKSFLSLLRADWTPATPWQMTFLYEKVMELVPVYSADCVVICDGLIWDRKTGEIKTFTKEDCINTVS